MLGTVVSRGQRTTKRPGRGLWLPPTFPTVPPGPVRLGKAGVMPAQVALRNWLWKLDRIQQEMERLAADMHVVFSLRTHSKGTSDCELDAFPFGRAVSQDVAYKSMVLDRETGSLWFSLGSTELPFVVCFDEETHLISMHKHFPAKLLPERDAEGYIPFGSLAWSVWHYYEGPRLEEIHGKEQIQAELQRRKDVSKVWDQYEAALEVCANAPTPVLEELGNLSLLGCWPTALFYLAMSRSNPLLSAWAAPAALQVTMSGCGGQGDANVFLNLYEWVLFLRPGDVATATRYAFDALRHMADDSTLPLSPRHRSADSMDLSKIADEFRKLIAELRTRATADEPVAPDLLQAVCDRRRWFVEEFTAHEAAKAELERRCRFTDQQVKAEPCFRALQEALPVLEALLQSWGDDLSSRCKALRNVVSMVTGRLIAEEPANRISASELARLRGRLDSLRQDESIESELRGLLGECYQAADRLGKEAMVLAADGCWYLTSEASFNGLVHSGFLPCDIESASLGMLSMVERAVASLMEWYTANLAGRPSEGSNLTTSNPVNIEALDERLCELLGLLADEKPLPRVAAAVRQFVQDHTSDVFGPRSLFRPEWEETWGLPNGGFANSWVSAADALDDREVAALTNVCVEAVRFLKDSDTPRRKEKHARQLREALLDYLDLRGYDVRTDQPGAETVTIAKGQESFVLKAKDRSSVTIPVDRSELFRLFAAKVACGSPGECVELEHLNWSVKGQREPDYESKASDLLRTAISQLNSILEAMGKPNDGGRWIVSKKGQGYHLNKSIQWYIEDADLKADLTRYSQSVWGTTVDPKKIQDNTPLMGQRLPAAPRRNSPGNDSEED